MRNVSNTTGPVSYGEASWETGDAPEASTGKSYDQELIIQANTVPLMSVFRHYGIRVDAVRCIIVCPFKSHKGGRESSGSFKYFSDTNSFCCFGCKTGGQWAHGVEFIAAMDGISRAKSAIKIIKLFGDKIDVDGVDDMYIENFAEKFEIMMNFSNYVRSLRQSNLDEKSTAYIEDICGIYDRMNLRHKLTSEALRLIVDELKEDIRLHTICPTP